MCHRPRWVVEAPTKSGSFVRTLRGVSARSGEGVPPAHRVGETPALLGSSISNSLRGTAPNLTGAVVEVLIMCLKSPRTRCTRKPLCTRQVRETPRTPCLCRYPCRHRVPRVPGVCRVQRGRLQHQGRGRKIDHRRKSGSSSSREGKSDTRRRSRPSRLRDPELRYPR